MDTDRFDVTMTRNQMSRKTERQHRIGLPPLPHGETSVLKHMNHNTNHSVGSISRLVRWIIGLSIILTIVVGIGGAVTLTVFAVSAVAKQDFSGGIRPIIEQVWCGEAGCLDNPNQ